MKTAAGEAITLPPDRSNLCRVRVIGDERLPHVSVSFKNPHKEKACAGRWTLAAWVQGLLWGALTAQGQSERPKPECHGATPVKVAVNLTGVALCQGL